MAKGPKPIGDVLSELMSRQGFASVKGAAAWDEAWRRAAGAATQEYSRVGNLRRGVLEICVANSTVMQELCFRKAALLKALQKQIPDASLENLRFRVGALR